MSLSKPFGRSLNIVQSFGQRVKPHLGPSRNISCVDGENGTKFIRDTVTLLDNLDIQDPIGQYILSVCHGFIHQYNTGEDTLLFFINSWTKAANTLVNMGISTSDVIQLLNIAVTDCIEHVETIKITVTDILNNSKPLQKNVKNITTLSGDESITNGQLSQPDNLSNNVVPILNENLDDSKLAKRDRRFTECGIEDEFETIQLNLPIATDEVEQFTNTLKLTMGSKQTDNYTTTEIAFDKISKKMPTKAEIRDIGNIPDIVVELIDTLSKPKKNEIDIIHLKMKVTPTSETEDDLSWFFNEDDLSKTHRNTLDIKKQENDSVQSLTGTQKSKKCHSDIERVIKPNVSEDKTTFLYFSGSNLDQEKDEIIVSQQDDTDDGIAKEIENLKEDIEADIKRILRMKEQTQHKIQERQDLLHQTCVESDDSDFDACFADEMNDTKLSDKDPDYSDIESHEFKSIQIQFDVQRNTESVFKRSTTENESTKEIDRVENSFNENDDEFGDCFENMPQEQSGIQVSFNQKHDNFAHLQNSSNSNEISESLSVHKRDNNLSKKETDIKSIDMLLKQIGGKHNTNVSSAKTTLQHSRHFKSFKDSNCYNDTKNISGVSKESLQVTNCNSDVSVRRLKKKYPLESPKSSLKVVQETKESTNTSKHKNISNLLQNLGLPDAPKARSNIKFRSRHLNESIEEHGPSNDTVINAPSVQSNTNEDSVLKSRCLEAVNENIVVTNGVKDVAHIKHNHLNKDTCTSENIGSTKCDIVIPGQRRNKTAGGTLHAVKTCKETGVDPNSALRQLISNLNVGTSEDVVNVVTDLVKQHDGRGDIKDIPSIMECYSTTGAYRQPVVVNGLIVSIYNNSMAAIQKLHGKACRVLIVNGDMSCTYRHKGYKVTKTTTVLSHDTFTGHVTNMEKWEQEIRDTLTSLKIDVILARGTISEDMYNICASLATLAIEMIAYKQLQLLGDAAGVDNVTYVTLATQDNICDGVYFSPWDSGWSDKWHVSSLDKQEVCITMATTNLKTVVLSELIPALVDLKEQEFWECLYKTTSVLQTDFLLPGNGHTELACVQYCRNRSELQKSNTTCLTFRSQLLAQVFDLLEMSFQEYVETVQENSQLLSDHDHNLDCVYDDYISKIASWKTALDTVCNIINTDTYIITGLTDEHSLYNSTVTL